jgi:hypothetical protein
MLWAFRRSVDREERKRSEISFVFYEQVAFTHKAF